MKYSILVTTCDSYSDTWEPFEILFKKFWPDCTADVYIVSESTVPKSDFYKKKFLTYSGCTWSVRVKIALEQIPDKSIMLLCDDYFLSNYVDNKKLISLYQDFHKFNAGNLRLSPNPVPENIFLKNSNFGEYGRSQIYRISTQVGFWKKDFLLDLIEGEFSIHNFERMGSFKSAQFNELILCTLKRSFPFIDSIHKGRWEVAAIQLCECHEIELNIKNRYIMNRIDYFKKYLKTMVFNLNPVLVTKIMAHITQSKSRINV